MRVVLSVVIAVSIVVGAGLAHTAEQQKSVCLKVNGEKIEIHHLASDPVVIDRDGIPDYVPTSMSKSISSATESKSYNIHLTGVKRNANKAITAFDVKIDGKAYTYPKDTCEK